MCNLKMNEELNDNSILNENYEENYKDLPRCFNEIDYITLLRQFVFFDNYYIDCDCKYRLRNEPKWYNRRCIFCIKDIVIRKIYNEIKYKLLDWSHCTFQDKNLSDEYIEYDNVLEYKTSKHYRDVGLYYDDPEYYNFKAQNIIAKCIFQYYQNNNFSNIQVYKNSVYFWNRRNKVIVRICDYNFNNRPSIVSFF